MSECSTYVLSVPCMRLDHDSGQVMKFVYMRTTCSVTILNMRLKQNWTYWSNKYLFFCLYIICVEYEYEAFNASSDEIRLMAFYLYPDFIDVSLKTWLSTSDEISIITNVFCLNYSEHELKKWLSPMDGSLAITHLSVTKKAWKNLTQSDENCVLALTYSLYVLIIGLNITCT